MIQPSQATPQTAIRPAGAEQLIGRQSGSLTRRQLIQGAITGLAGAAIAPPARASTLPAAELTAIAQRQNDVEKSSQRTENVNVAYGKTTLPPGIRSRFVNNSNGLRMHVLEAGFEVKDRPCILLLHGYPELAYSWRKTMLPLAQAGFYVVAPDQRGYGRTTGWDGDYDGDVDSFRFLNLARDTLGLVCALGYRSVAAVMGHDFGSLLAGWCTLIRPDVFRSMVLMSAPFPGPPSLLFNATNEPLPYTPLSDSNLYDELAALPRPRKYYRQYYSTREANNNMLHCPQGIHNFLRAYYHVKSADWEQNKPFRLQSESATEMAKLPPYYVMDLDKGMAETVASEMPSASAIASCKWLPDEALRVYSTEFGRTGFQGGLQWYRCLTNPKYRPELEIFSGLTIDVPSCFIAGTSDWAAYQNAGHLERMQNKTCTQMLGVHFVKGAGHWVQQEQPEAVNKLLLQFLQQV